MKLIVGLGNDEKKYKDTRHNIGFKFIDAYSEHKGIKKFNEKFNSDYIMIGKKQKIILLKPKTYMNLSGLAVKEVSEYYKIEPENILIIHDDMDLEIGKYKLRKEGGSGGHNGIKSIIENLGTNKFNRLKIGVDRPKNKNNSNYVLSKFKKSELEIINEQIPTIINLLEDYEDKSIIELMNKYN